MHIKIEKRFHSYKIVNLLVYMINLHPSLTANDSISSPDLASMLSIIPPLVSSIKPSDPAQKSLSNKIQEASGYFVKLWSQRLSFLARVVDTSKKFSYQH